MDLTLDLLAFLNAVHCGHAEDARKYALLLDEALEYFDIPFNEYRVNGKRHWASDAQIMHAVGRYAYGRPAVTGQPGPAGRRSIVSLAT
jgi:hypothetical protein